MKTHVKYLAYICSMVLLTILFANISIAQRQDSIAQNIPPKPAMQEVMKDWGPNDSLKVAAIWYGTNYNDFKMMPYTLEEDIWLSNMSLHQLAKVKAENARLRNAVYVTYPYAREAGNVINDINKLLDKVDSRSGRKAIIKSKEKELKEKFADKVKNLSVYQGEILMKLINRQTGNNCYELLKEYKGGFNTTIFQATAWVYGGNLKAGYDIKNDKRDRQIEIFVREIDGNWYNNPFRR